MSYELRPNSQIWPRALNGILGGDERRIYLVAGDLGHPSGSGLDFISKNLFFSKKKEVERRRLTQMDSRFYNASIPSMTLLTVALVSLTLTSQIPTLIRVHCR